MKKPKMFVFGLCLAAVLAFMATAFSQTYRADGNKAKSYIEFLASDQLEGRQTMTPGYKKAADYVAARFKEWGLEPCGDAGTSYFQKVPIGRPVTVNSGIPSFTVDNRIFYFDDSDFTVNTLSTAKTAVKSEVIFVGYGISLPAKGLDEYAGLNVQGKVVLVYKGNPESFAQPRGIFTETAAKTPAPIGLTPEEVTDNAKIKTAYDKGAAAILLYSPDPPDAPWRHDVLRARRTATAIDSRNQAEFPRFRDHRPGVPRDRQESAPGIDARIWPEDQQIAMGDRNKKPQSKATGSSVSLKGYDDIKKYSGDGLNVIGKIEGTDSVLKNQYIVLGGHLDHLGARGAVVYNGADDDASGVATVMEVARVLGQAKFQPKRTIVFAGWCGEEMGLLGSNYFGTKPPAGITMDQVVANFNCDMVGLGDFVDAPGALNFPDIWEKVIKRDQDPDVIAAIKPATGGPGGSDHSTFITKGIESMALMSGGGGGHPDYHDSGDDASKIEPEIMRKVSQFVVQGTMNLANETTVNLVVPDRLYLYNSLMMRVTIINTAMPQSTWRNTDYPSKSTLLARMYEREVMLNAQAQAQALAAARAAGPVFMFAAAPTPPPPPIPVRKDFNQGVRSMVFAGDAKLLKLASNTLGFGRVEFTGDDGTWVVNGRLTDAGKSAIKTMETNGIVYHLVNPSDDLLNDVLTAAERPLVVAGTYNLSPAAKNLVVSKKAIVSVDFDPADVQSTINKADEAKKQVGAATNLIAFVKSTDKINDLDFKRAFYFGLIKKGWTTADISAFIGGSLTILRATGPAVQR